jgi:hypothetical protein
MVARFFLVQLTKTGENIPNDHKIHQIPITFTKWPQTIPNGHKIYQHFPFQGPPKCIQMGIFGMKINHLATLSHWSIDGRFFSIESTSIFPKRIFEVGNGLKVTVNFFPIFCYFSGFPAGLPDGIFSNQKS